MVQAAETAKALERLGVTADLSSELEPDLDRYDAVHLFNIVRPHEAWVQAGNAVTQHRKVLLSTVYCDTGDFDKAGRGRLMTALTSRMSRDTLESGKALARSAMMREFNRATRVLVRQGYTRLQVELLRLADAFLPNSESEMRRLQADLGVDVPAAEVFPVPNGIDPDFYRPEALASEEPPRHLAGLAGCVLCVARVGGAKNQLGLVRALADTGLTLVLAGGANTVQAGYLRHLRREAGEKVKILGFVTEDEKRWLYKLARVHVLPSWIETTGLSSLEAAAMGCAIVTTSRGDDAEYFGEMAHYCDPSDTASIRSSVLAAYGAGAQPKLAEKVGERYTWAAAGEATLRAYRAVGMSDVESNGNG